MAEKDVITLTLNRGQNGLGFNIRGGKDQRHLPNDDGIFVTKIRDNGAAAVDGTLQEGDKILEINGNNMENVSHNEGVNLFLSAGDEVTLKIWRGAERALLDEYEREIKKQNASSRKKVILVVAGVILVGALIYYRKDVVDQIKKLASKIGFDTSV